jgi:hypothetical protein
MIAATPGLRRRIARWLAPDAVRESAEYQEDDALWRPYSQPVSREEPSTDLRGQLAASDDAYRHHPMAHRAIELTVDYILGRGMSLRTTRHRARQWLDSWWQHPENRWQLRQFELVRELCLAGEVFVVLHTSPIDRMTRVRLMPASLIDEIETDPEDVETEARYHQSGQVGRQPGADVEWRQLDGRWWPHASDDPTEPVMRHYAINRLPGTLRGQGDLVTILPWLIRYKDWLTDRVRLNKYQQAFVFDVTLEGADRRALVARRNEIAVAPDPGSIIVHNEREKWQAVRPALNAQSAEADGMALRLMIAAGAGFPLHFMGEAENANLATATAMEGPALRRLERRQLQVAAILEDLAAFALRRAGFDEPVRAEYASLRTADTGAIASAANLVTQALATAKQSGWVSDVEAREILARFLGEQAAGQTLGEER